MRKSIIVAAATLALAGCGGRSPPAATPAAQASDGAMQTPEQLSAQAAKDEAEANRLLAQANAQGQGAAPAALPGQPDPPSPGPNGAVLGPNSQKLHSGQYYESINFNAVPGKTYMVTYDTQGYRPALIVLDGSNQMFSQSSATPQGAGTYHLETEIKPDTGGNWHVLLSETDAGATGSFTVNLQEIHETVLN